jgi:hypothetical protein
MKEFPKSSNQIGHMQVFANAFFFDHFILLAFSKTGKQNATRLGIEAQLSSAPRLERTEVRPIFIVELKRRHI